MIKWCSGRLPKTIALVIINVKQFPCVVNWSIQHCFDWDSLGTRLDKSINVQFLFSLKLCLDVRLQLCWVMLATFSWVLMIIHLAVKSNADVLYTHTLGLYSLPVELPWCFPELSNTFLMHFSPLAYWCEYTLYTFPIDYLSNLTCFFLLLFKCFNNNIFNNNIAETTIGFIDLLNLFSCNFRLGYLLLDYLKYYCNSRPTYTITSYGVIDHNPFN